MPNPSDDQARLAALEARMEEVAADATAARHLAATGDRDLADLGMKVDANRTATNALGVQVDANRTATNALGVQVDANRTAINALGVQTAGRFEQVDRRFDRLEDEMRTGFAEMRGRLDGAAAGQQQIVDLLTGLIADRDDT